MQFFGLSLSLLALWLKVTAELQSLLIISFKNETLRYIFFYWYYVIWPCNRTQSTYKHKKQNHLNHIPLIKFLHLNSLSVKLNYRLLVTTALTRRTDGNNAGPSFEVRPAASRCRNSCWSCRTDFLVGLLGIINNISFFTVMNLVIYCVKVLLTYIFFI